METSKDNLSMGICCLDSGCIFPSIWSWMTAHCLSADFPWKVLWRYFPFTNRNPFTKSLSEELRRENIRSPTMQNICIYICLYIFPVQETAPESQQPHEVVSLRTGCGMWHSESVTSLENSASISVTAGHSCLCRLLSIQLSLFYNAVFIFLLLLFLFSRATTTSMSGTDAISYSDREIHTDRSSVV